VKKRKFCLFLYIDFGKRLQKVIYYSLRGVRVASIKDVAKQAGVSIATVSRVLANKPHVRPEVREHVLKVVEELGYRPNRTASSLRKQSSQFIGLIVSDVRNPYFTAIARAIEDIAIANEMSVFFCNTDEDQEKEQLYLRNLLDENVAGIILSPTVENIESFRFIIETDIPVVTIDRRIEGANIDSVLGDNVPAAQLITNHLIKNGYTRIGAVIGLKGSTTGRERMQGFKLSFVENNLDFDPQFITFTQPNELGGKEVVEKWLNMPNPPEAILTGNGLLTIGAISAISQAGLTIPDEIALAGFDDASWMPFLGPGITVISQPNYEIGQVAAELLFERMEDNTRPAREVVLKGKLITRASTRPR
jgi:LacI family transcriptional regulator, fructose operon transcriptional repressor